MSDVATLDRFYDKFLVGDGCWEWQGYRNDSGHGRFWYGGRLGYAYRFAYEILVGAIPPGLTIDHLCRNKVEPTRQYFAELRASLKNALDVQRDVEAECGRLREREEQLSGWYNRAEQHITELKAERDGLREQLDAARQALEAIVAESSHTMILKGASLARARAALGVEGPAG